jgi:hypothetical protein
MTGVPFPVVIRDMKGTEDAIEVYGDYKVQQLKTVVSLRKGIPESKIDFVFNGKPLDNELVLAQGGVQKHAVIYIVNKMK